MRNIKIIFIAVCILSILIPVIFADYEGGKSSKLDNRVMAKGPAAFFHDGSKVDITKWINDNIGFRSTMLGLKGYIEYNILHKSPTSKVMLGKDGFMFYTWGNNIEIAQNKYPLNEREIRQTVKSLIIINDILEKDNKTFIFTIAPSKVSIYPEYLSNGNYKRTVTPIDIFSERLKNKINFINLKDVLYTEKEKNKEQLLYFKTDTHWNEYGAYIGYKKIIDKMNEINVFDKKEEYIPVTFYETTRTGEFANMMGGEFVLKPENVIGSKIINSTIQTQDYPDYLNAYKSKFKPIRIYYYENKNNEKNKNILLFSDSMFGSWNIPQLFANHFNTYTHIWEHQFDNETIYKSNSDVIMLEMAERYSNKILKVTNDFVKEHYKPTAYITSDDIPEVMENGKQYSFTINIKNTGKYNLGYDYLTMAGILMDKNAYSNIDQGVRFYLPKDTVIRPGETYSLKVINFTPNYKGKEIIFKAGEEYVNWMSNSIRVELK